MADDAATPEESTTPRDPSTPGAPEATAGEPTAQQTPAARPRPAFGELAPEGWEWKPEGQAAATPAASDSRTGSPAAAGTPAASLTGVPHNLGANLPKRGAKPAPGARAAGSGAPPAPPTGQGAQGTSTQGSGAPGSPYRAPQAAASTVTAQPGAPRPRMADRVITIGLLIVGAFSTLSLTSAFFALESQIRLTATALGLEHATLASWVAPLGTASGFAVLALFAVTLIFSIQRMRAGKLAFWVPLSAGVIAVLLLLIIPTVAMLAGAPEIMQQLETDPNGSISKMLEYAQNMQ